MYKVEYDTYKPVPSEAAQTCWVSCGVVKTPKQDHLSWVRYALVPLLRGGVQWAALVRAVPSATALARGLLC